MSETRFAMLRLALSALLAVALGVGAAAGAEPEKGSPLSLLRTIDEGFTQLFEKIAPSVVVIEAVKKPDPEDRDELKSFESFLKESEQDRAKTAGEASRSMRLPAPPVRSEGSGFVLRSDGYILTNHHVIATAEKLTVRLRDGRTFPAKIVGADDKTDIAVIRIEARDLPAVELGDSDALRVGQLVCAIGIPFSQDYSFTAGWVSGKERTNLLGPTSPAILYEDYIQTDAFINPGNSGGPLFDVEGKIVGMNTLINAVDRGIAFAIPSNMLQQVSAQLIQGGRVQRPWLGIRIETLGRNGAGESVTGIEKGVVVLTKEANAPAARSDLRPTDVITEVDGVRVSAAHDLQKEILKKKVGQTVQLTVWRGGSSLSVPVATGELPNELAKPAVLLPRKAVEPRLEAFGLKLKDRKPQGATVVGIVPDTAAAGADLQPDDVISEVDAKPVADAEECITTIALRAQASKGKGVTLNVERKGKRISILLNPEK